MLTGHLVLALTGPIGAVGQREAAVTASMSVNVSGVSGSIFTTSPRFLSWTEDAGTTGQWYQERDGFFYNNKLIAPPRHLGGAPVPPPPSTPPRPPPPGPSPR